MISGLKGMMVTLRWLGKKNITASYPKEHLPVQDRFMGFPGLLWDETAEEPFCTGCMVCVRECPTQCMTAIMHDNPNAAEGTSHRRKIIETFEINLNRCILCGICVDVCNFDAIAIVVLAKRAAAEAAKAAEAAAAPKVDEAPPADAAPEGKPSAEIAAENTEGSAS
jgi:formate hydrogenlyase subunit 6/NADH:ubiquinone oxidoreductase subunit I